MIDIITKQRDFFNSNKTKDINFRISQLKKLKNLIIDNEKSLYQAIYSDFGKSEFDTYVAELSMVYHEINNCIKNLKKWSKRIKVPTNLTNLPGKSYVIPEPLGSVLVIGAWNYPFQLSLIPAISAISAGNTVILKPSELPLKTSQVIAKIINNNFSEDFFTVIEGGVDTTTELLKHKFDKIFFTGSTNVGRIVYQAAAKHLTPVVLELGGKSPTFVFADCNINMTAKRIVWAKFFNAGQTCIAPDYILVEKSIETEFLSALKLEIEKYYKNKEDISDNYPRIINSRNFERLAKLIDHDKVFCGGNINKDNRFISPTILNNIEFDHKIMEDEIFGPILPVISFSDINTVIKEVKNREKPLSCYIYSKNKKTINKILHEISFGGGAVNDSLIHITNDNLPFGGIGSSGMGNYHGLFGFKSFSHYKSILHKSFWIEPSLKYFPYTKNKINILKRLLK